MTRDMICIVCPKGCPLRVSLENGAVTEVSGHTCPRGKQYAIDECTHPVRTVTSTVRASTGGVIPVKTSAPIPKERMFELMNAINKVTATLPVRIGDVILQDPLGIGVSVIATANVE